MLLSHDEISDLIDDNVIEYAEKEHINSSSLDIRIGATLLIERPFLERGKSLQPNEEPPLRRISLKKRQPLHMIEHDLMREPFILYPGEFILAQSHELFNLPNDISAEYKLKSSMARIGLEHLNAGWCDAGWHGSVLTLEIKNMTRHHEIVIEHLDKIGQIVFFRHRAVKPEHSYATRGRYNKHKTVMGAVTDPLIEKRNVLVVGDEDESV